MPKDKVLIVDDNERNLKLARDVLRAAGFRSAAWHPMQLSPEGSRSFPRKNLSKGINEWNHYYVRAINGEIRLRSGVGSPLNIGTTSSPPAS